MKAVLFALNAKYIHSSLAPWCLLAGVEAAGPAGVCAEVREGTVNEPERDVLARILDGEPDAVLFWNCPATEAVDLTRSVPPAIAVVEPVFVTAPTPARLVANDVHPRLVIAVLIWARVDTPD